MTFRPNLLIVCGRNKRRSRTAGYIFKNDDRLYIRSVRLSPKSERKIQEQDVEWSDLSLVMEPGHKARIKSEFRHLHRSKVEMLHIADEFEYLNEELITMITERINETLRHHYDI